MPGRIFFRDGRATVTSSEFTVGQRIFPLAEIVSARGVKRRCLLPVLQPNRFALVITTAQGEWEVLRERDGYVVFQLAKAIETALRETKRQNGKSASLNGEVGAASFHASPVGDSAPKLGV